MGKGDLNKRHNKNGADGAYQRRVKTEDKPRLRFACAAIINYLRTSGITIGGCSYGSDMLTLDPHNLAELCALVGQHYMSHGGEPMPFTMPEVAVAYNGVRKGNYADLRDGRQLRSAPPLPLFPSPLDDSSSEPDATLYAYLGSNQTARRWLIKIGYTSQPLCRYLANYKRAYDPQLLATKPGGRFEEAQEHARWRMFLVEGREWFCPVPAIFDALRREWHHVTDEFDRIVEEALKETM